jgi:phosphoadenosine phosphosulfate reductase
MPDELRIDALQSLDAAALVHELMAEANGDACITCSFQAEDMAVLHMLREIHPAIPVIFLETGYHFAETIAYKQRMVADWALNVIEAKAEMPVAQQESQFGILNQTDPAKCCHLRKVEPLMESLRGYKFWFTGLRREQSPSRAGLQPVEHHRLPSGELLLKISPLANWRWKEVWNYCKQHDIPRLPLYDRGYTSIGCEPCTSLPVGEDMRSGRWAGRKLECGIHTETHRE